MKLTRKYEITVDNLDYIQEFLREKKLGPNSLVSELVDTCTRYLDAGEMSYPELYLQEEEIKIRGEPTYSWCIWADLDHDSARPPIFGPVVWSGKELDYDIEW